ncbi:unnamed protein product [Rotaria sp. Silwood1]|nr:unnamed protein product [Rotaria sp. Silwood1]
MVVDPIIQAEFERNLSWKRSWPRCVLGSVASIEIFVGLIIFLTEICNILMDFWHTNVFGGIWASIMIFINVIVIYATAQNSDSYFNNQWTFQVSEVIF